MCLKVFLIGALAALLFGVEGPFTHFSKTALWGTFMLSNMKFGPVVQEEMLFKEKVTEGQMEERQTKADHNCSPRASAQVS